MKELFMEHILSNENVAGLMTKVSMFKRERSVIFCDVDDCQQSIYQVLEGARNMSM